MTTNAAFQQACSKVGGQTAMARLLKTSQANVWAWINKRPLPAEYVLTIEGLSGVSRHRLRPDIYPKNLTQGNGEPSEGQVAAG